jgi:MazG family protein
VTSPRVVLVETSDVLPGLLPFQAWDALATADAVFVRDVEAHPAAPHLHLAGLDLAELEPVELDVRRIDLGAAGDPAERRLAKALLEHAAAHGTATYLMGPGDERFQPVVAMASPEYDAEIELVFFAQQPLGSELLRLVEVEQRLRDPEGGCPWDLEQDHTSLRPYLLEEVYELLEAIDGGTDPAILEELGDVLLQVVFHAQIAADRGAFTIDDAARAIADKLVHRHPHVFGDVEVADAAEVKRNWDELKQAEKGRTGPFEGVPEALPALVLADKLQRRAAKQGFDWRDAAEPADRVRQELDELSEAADAAAREEELGDLLGAVVGLARHLDLDPEQALRQAAGKFRRRFEAVHEAAQQRDSATDGLDRDTWLALWEQVKAEEGGR